MGVKFGSSGKLIIGGQEFVLTSFEIKTMTREQPGWRSWVPGVREVTWEFHVCHPHRVKDGGMVMLRHLDGSYCTRPKSCRKFHDWNWQGVGDG